MRINLIRIFVRPRNNTFFACAGKMQRNEENFDSEILFLMHDSLTLPSQSSMY